MSGARKTCLFRGCLKDPQATHFKFPEEKTRFIIWCKNAGLFNGYTGSVDIQETRYLCEKHFSGNYMCTQARRKMLVQTAVPERCKGFEDYEVQFTVVGGSSDGKRKINRDYTLDELTLPVTKRVITSSPTILNSATPETKPLRVSSRSSVLPSTSAAIASIKTDNSPAQTIKIQRRVASSASTSKSPVYEEIVYKSPPKKYSLLVVKPKSEPKPIILNQVTIAPASNEETYEDNPVYSIEEENISSTQLVEDKPVEPEKAKDMEKYSEFIFNGEMYVQMPKRVFEAEKARIRKECDKYKLLLRKLKSHLAKMPELD